MALCCPASNRATRITPLLKKADLDAADVKSYRPITNLSVVSKLLERLVAQQVTTYLMTDNGLLPDLQSAYRAHHSTETAVLKVVGDILLALDSSNLALLSLLYLSVRSTLSTTTRCFDGCRRPTASTVSSSNGSRPT